MAVLILIAECAPAAVILGVIWRQEEEVVVLGRTVKRGCGVREARAG